jgi:peptidoglycan/LPS O-acetylase OafA/YrhL
MLLALIRARWAMNGPPAWLRGVLLRSDLWILATVPLWAAVVLGNYDLVWLIGIAGFLTIGACVLPLRPGLLTRALEWRLLAALGVASYSLYLWHGHVIDVLVNDVGVSTALAPLAAIAIPVAIAAAVLSYGVIERPFLRLRRRWSSASAPTQDPAEAPAPTS